MNFEVNKIAGAVLVTALGVMAVGIVAELVYAPPQDQKPGYVIAVAETGGGTETGGGQAEVPPIAERLQTASVDHGQDVAKKCLTCHTLEKGQPAKVGPNLWGVVGGPAAHMEGFDYSDAMEAKHQEGFTWTFENLDQFLTNPKGFIPGTAMAFAGLKKPEDRADVIAYLRTLSDNPVPLPAPTAAAPAAGDTAAAPDKSGTAAATPPAPAAEAPAPAPAEKPAPDNQGGASSGDSGGAQPVPAPKEAPNPAPADKPSEAPAQ